MSRRSVCTMVVIAALSFWLGTPAWAQQSSLSLNLGYFALRGEDTRISDDVIIENLGLFAFGLDQFNNASVGAEWLVGFGEYVEVGFGVGFYQQTVLSVYDDFVNVDGTEIEQDFKLHVAPVTGTARFFPFGQRSAIQPYAGAGVGFFNWRYSEVSSATGSWPRATMWERCIWAVCGCSRDPASRSALRSAIRMCKGSWASTRGSSRSGSIWVG